MPPLLPLPEDLFTIEVCEGEETCLGSLREYHRVRCEDQPATEIGRSVADDQGWGGQLQRLAADGCPTGSRSICNTLVIVHERCTGEAVGLLAMCFTSRGCLVQAIHVVPRLRGPLRLPEQLWRKARAKIACEACEQQRRSYRVTAETACNQAPAAAAFSSMHKLAPASLLCDLTTHIMTQYMLFAQRLQTYVSVTSDHRARPLKLASRSPHYIRA